MPDLTRYIFNPMKVLIVGLYALIVLLSVGERVAAHEVRPAYVEIMLGSDVCTVVWKQPIVGDAMVSLAPVISGDWLEKAPESITRTPTYLVTQWRVPAPAGSLEGQTISIKGLERTITDVILRIHHLDGHETTHLLRPDSASFTMATGLGSGDAVLPYLLMGIEHILFGFDHLLFVLGLLLLVRGRRRLLWTITAFTAAHSVTLGLTAVGFWTVSAALIESAVALSILFVAVEVANLWRGRLGWSSRWPWAVAFMFGLLHGCAFASALADIGLPTKNGLPALLLFNLGVEIGQVAFVTVVLFLHRALVVRWLAPKSRIRWIAPYAIGCMAAYWFIDRTTALFFPAA